MMASFEKTLTRMKSIGVCNFLPDRLTDLIKRPSDEAVL